MRLAAQTHCTLEELGDRMSAEEFGLWLEFLEVEPIGPASMLPLLAEVLSALANGPLKAPRGRNAYSPSDFLDTARWQPPKPVAEASPLQQFQQFIAPGA